MSSREKKNNINHPKNLQIKENGFSQKDNHKQENEIESYNDASEEMTTNDIIQDNKIKTKEDDINEEESKKSDKNITRKKGKKGKFKNDKESNEENKKKHKKKKIIKKSESDDESESEPGSSSEEENNKKNKKNRNSKHKKVSKKSETEEESDDGSESPSEKENKKSKKKKGIEKGKRKKNELEPKEEEKRTKKENSKNRERGKKVKKKSESESNDESSEKEEEEEEKLKKKKNSKNRERGKKIKKKSESESNDESSEKEEEEEGEEEEEEEEEKRTKKEKKRSKKVKEESENEAESPEEEKRTKKVKKRSKKVKEESENEAESPEEEKKTKKEKKRSTKVKEESEDEAESSKEEEKTKKGKKHKRSKMNNKEIKTKKKEIEESNDENEFSEENDKKTLKKSQKKIKKDKTPSSDDEEKGEEIEEEEEIKGNNETKNNDELVKKLEDKKIIINKIIEFLEDNMTEIESIKGHEEIKKLIKEFKCKYYPYKNIRRFSIPVIGCVSSGKSTILNYLLRLKKILEMAQEITTKCICIIRHQKGNKKAKIYTVKIVRRGESNDGLYNFEKGEEIKENVSEVIAERNKLIAENKVGCDYEKYFLIIEYEIPFFVGDMEKYADLFEFMDVPGLNERSDIKENSNNNSNKQNISNITSGFYFRQIFPLIRNNIKFSLFIFGADIYDKTNAKEILLGYINQENKYFDNNSSIYSNFASNGEQDKYLKIKQKKNLEKKEQREYCSLESFRESIFILNKIDIFNSEEREKGNQTFIEYMEKEFKGDKFIKLNEENEIATMGLILNEEISKNDSFKQYLSYYNLLSKEIKDHSNSFYEYIVEMMNKDFKLKIKIEENESDEESSENDNDFNLIIDKKKSKEKIPPFMDEEEYETYKSLRALVDKNIQFNSFLSKTDFHELHELFKENHKRYEKNKEVSGIEKIIRNKMKKVIDDFFSIDIYASMPNKIISDFKIDPEKNNKLAIKNRMDEMVRSSRGIANPTQCIKDFNNYINKLYSFDNQNQTIKEIKNDYNIISNYLENTSAVRFLLVGPHNSGKSSLLNLIIGYNQYFLPTKTQECTKIGVIIKYAKKGETIKMYETQFKTNANNLNYFEYNENYPIAEGKDAILNKIDQLNNSKDAKNYLRFYLVKAPIEFLDQMNLSEKEKKKIELIDFPGLDTDFNEAKKKAANLLKIIDGFIYVNYQVHFDDGDQQILALMYNTIKQRSNFSFNTCLFILNKYDLLGDQEIKLEEVAKRILDILDKENVDSSSIMVLEQKERIGDKSLSLTPFSCEKYKEYKKFETNLLNFEKFIEINSIKNNQEKKKFSDYVSLMNPLNLFQDENIVNIIIKNMEKNYFEKINLKKVAIPNNAFEEYLSRLNKIITIKNVKKKDLEKIVLLYFYIVQNKKKYKPYRTSYIDYLLNNFQTVITNTLEFFEKKKQKDALLFISKCYEKMNDLYHVVKLKMENENIDAFQKIDKNKIFKEIEKETRYIKEDIETEIDSNKRIVENKINICKENEDAFKTMVSENSGIIGELINKIKNKNNRLDQILREKNDIIIENLNLKELEKEKSNFRENMSKFEEINITDNVSSGSDSYISKYEKSWKTGWWLWEETHYKTVYEHSKTIGNYRAKLDTFFKDTKKNSLESIEDKKTKTIENIDGIFGKFNEEINGFKKNINEFKKIVDQVEDFIYKNTGIK